MRQTEHTPEYVIAWRTRISGISRQGTQRLTYQDAVAWCKEMNLQYPDIVHWPVGACDTIAKVEKGA